MLEPIPGLSVLKVLSPAIKPAAPPADPKLMPFDVRNTATALVTVALSCAFGLRPPNVLRAELYSNQVRRHVGFRLRHGYMPQSRRRDMKINSFHFNTREAESLLLIDVFGSVSVGAEHRAYTALLETLEPPAASARRPASPYLNEKSAGCCLKMQTLRII
ncbi:MAG: hypothetical protein Q4A82_00205 [Corynebacterium sp.]|nr:hypothetical protein [Corynebacterium sp.]